MHRPAFHNVLTVSTIAILAALALLAGCGNRPGVDIPVPGEIVDDPTPYTDTFDPTAMAERTLDFLGNNLDCDRTCVPRFHTTLGRVVESRHANWDYGDLMGRYSDAFVLLRAMTGHAEFRDREERMRAAWLDTFAGDGLSYRPDGPFSDREADVFDQSSSLIGLVTWYEQTGDPKVRRMIDRMIVRLSEIAVHEPDGACRFAYPTYLPDGSEGPHRDNWRTADPAHHGGRLLVGLAGYLEAAPDENAADHPARRLADCLARHVTRPGGLFDREGSDLINEHLHSRTDTLVGLLRLARIDGDVERFRLVADTYGYLRTVGTSFGWFPEVLDPAHPNNPRTRQAEGETTGDMIRLALLLAEGLPATGIAPDPAYYDDAERFARNHLAESQLAALPDDVERREEAIGAFAGFAQPNDWGRRTMNCCAGGAARALFLMWSRQIARDANGDVRVNLLFDGRRHDLRVDSQLPFEGAVDLSASRTMTVRVRVPGWVGGVVRIESAGGERTATVRDGYVTLPLAADESARIAFDLPRRTDRADTPAGRYVVSWVGDTVVRIDPPGTEVPLYRHRDTPPRAITKRYFEPEKTPIW